MKTFETTTGKLFNTFLSMNNAGVMNLAFSRKGSLSVYRNSKKIEDELKTYNDQRNALIKEFAGEGSESISPENPRWEDFQFALTQLDSVEIKMEINTIGEDDLPESITPASIAVINFMFD